jgi:hypothetical protein
MKKQTLLFTHGVERQKRERKESVSYCVDGCNIDDQTLIRRARQFTEHVQEVAKACWTACQERNSLRIKCIRDTIVGTQEKNYNIIMS